jgi:hypothetical protein
MERIVFPGLFVAALLFSPEATRTLHAQCSPNHPLRVHVIADNSSVREEFPGYRENMKDWLHDLAAVLRPGDSIFVHPLVTAAGQTLESIAAVRVELDQPRPFIREFDSERIAGTLRTRGATRSDIAETLAAARRTYNPAARACSFFLLITDGRLAPIQDGLYRRDAQQALRSELREWPHPRPLLVTRITTTHTGAFDHLYPWHRSIGQDTLSTLQAKDLIEHEFGSVLGWDDHELIADALYFGDASPFTGAHRFSRQRAIRGVRSPYILYRVRADPEWKNDPFLSCGGMAPTLEHFVTSAGGNNCIHHLVGFADTLPSRLGPAPIELRRVPSSTLVADATPDPILSPAQILIEDTLLRRRLPGCRSDVARQMIEEHGWESAPRTDRITVTLQDHSGIGKQDTVIATNVRGTSCYAVADLHPRTRYTADTESMTIEFGRGDGPENEATRRRVRGQPYWYGVDVKHLIGFTTLSVDAWFAEGRITLPSSSERPSLLIGDKVIPLVEKRGCENMESGRSCYGFAHLFSDGPNARGLLLFPGDDRMATQAVPLSVLDGNPVWNSAGWVLPPSRWGALFILSGLLSFVHAFLRFKSARSADFWWVFSYTTVFVFACVIPLAEFWYVVSYADSFASEALDAGARAVIPAAFAGIHIVRRKWRRHLDERR